MRTIRRLPFSQLHCQNLVYKSDWESAICIKSVSDLDKRRSLFALRAFNCAILTSIDKVSKPIFAQARIDFLRVGLNQIYNKEPIPDHPVLRELELAIEKNKYPKRWLSKLIDERLSDDRLNRRTFRKLADMEKYHEQTIGNLWLLSLMTVGVKELNCDVAAKHAARCVGLTNAIRAQPLMQKRELLVPLEFTAKHKINPREIIEKRNSKVIEDLVFDVASIANANLTKVQSMRSKIPSEAHDIFRQLTPSEIFLKNLESANFNMYESSLSQRDHFLPLRLVKKRWQSKF